MKHRLQVIHRSLGLMALTGTLLSGTVMAAAPMAEKQAPGYYRMVLGSFEVTALSDGTVKLPVDDLLLNTTREHVHERLADNYLSAPLSTSVNGYLINTGDKLVLIDTGAGSLFGPTLGNLVDNLKASGYEPRQVDAIYITHMHPDHVGGLISDGNIVFPNATIRANQVDANYWLSEENLNAAEKNAKGFFQGAMASLNPYVKAGQFEAFEGNSQILTGISTVEAKGHTPGHTMYKVESEGNILMLWGDLIHVAAVQFPEPDIAIQFDTNSENAVRERMDEFEHAADVGYLVGSAHLSFPGLGHVTKAGEGYKFIPANYETGE